MCAASTYHVISDEVENRVFQHIHGKKFQDYPEW